MSDCPSWAATSSMRRISASASRTRPCVISHRGLSGRLRRTYRTTMARAGPTRNAIRQPMLVRSEFSSRNVTNVPMIAPSQYVPLIQTSVRPR